MLNEIEKTSKKNYSLLLGLNYGDNSKDSS